jgi:diguanylate cyclase
MPATGGAARLPAQPALPDRLEPGGDQQARRLAFVRRVFRLRVLGLGIGAVCVASVLDLHQAHPGWWVLLVAYSFAWPHLARALVARRPDPGRAETWNLLFDSAMGGVWIAAMRFNLLPSVLLATMLTVDKVSVGGAPLAARSTVLLAVACAVTSAALGFPVDLATPMPVLVACLPLLVAYPLAISGATNALRRRIARQNKVLLELGRTDDLTGLANRRLCLEIVESELARVTRAGKQSVLMMIDVDHFKSINDRHGHPVGDEVLRALAAVLVECGRAQDTPSRYGGDEFLVLLPETDLRGAAVLAERIRQRLGDFTSARAPGLRCTVSLGAAETSAGMDDPTAWIQAADEALYRAKAAGRDRFAI